MSDLPASPPQYDPRVQLVRFPSAILGVERSFYIYLPPEYATSEQRFPVLYLLRGHEREWVNPYEDGARGGVNVVDVYLRLRAEGRVGPLMMVMPGLASDDNHIPGMLIDFRAPHLANDRPGIGTGRFERYFVDELLPRIDRDYRALPGARAIAGFSLGGMMAVKAAATYPQLFVSVGAYDGSFFYAADAGRSVRPGDALLEHPMFDPALGLPRDPDFITANSPVNLLLRADPDQIRRLAWFIQYGSEQIEPWGSNFYRGEHLLRALSYRGVQNGLPAPVLVDGDHSWRTADRHIEQTLPLHWAALQEACGA